MCGIDTAAFDVACMGMRKEYGSKFEAGLDVVSIAQRMRADIKAAVAAGDLPADVQYSVGVRRYAGGQSIDIRVAVDRARVANPEYDFRSADDAKRSPVNAEGRKIYATLQAIHDAYNYDRSDVQVDYFDVNYYGSVDLVEPKPKAVKGAAFWVTGKSGHELYAGNRPGACAKRFKVGSKVLAQAVTDLNALGVAVVARASYGGLAVLVKA